MCDCCLTTFTFDHINEAFRLANYQVLIRNIDHGGDIWLLTLHIEYLFIRLHVVYVYLAIFTTQSKALRLSMISHLIYRKALCVHLFHQVMCESVEYADLASGRSY